METRSFWVRNLEAFVSGGSLKGEELDRTRSVIAELKMADSTIPLRLLGAAKGMDSSGRLKLLISYYDEARVFSSIRVREYAQSGSLIVCEDYLVHPGGRLVGAWADGIVVDVQARTEESDTEPVDGEPVCRRVAGEGAPCPSVFISLPSDARRITISLLDATGVETDPIEISPVS